VKYLSVFINEKLNWSSHLQHIESNLDFAANVTYKPKKY